MAAEHLLVIYTDFRFLLVSGTASCQARTACICLRDSHNMYYCLAYARAKDRLRHSDLPGKCHADPISPGGISEEDSGRHGSSAFILDLPVLLWYQSACDWFCILAKTAPGYPVPRLSYCLSGFSFPRILFHGLL